jgi:hypothetical protein
MSAACLDLAAMRKAARASAVSSAWPEAEKHRVTTAVVRGRIELAPLDLGFQL